MVGKSTLRNGPRYGGPAEVPVPEQCDAVERERHPEQCVGPHDRAVVERRDEPADCNRDRECRKSGSPPCQLGALAGKLCLSSRVIRHQQSTMLLRRAGAFAQFSWPAAAPTSVETLTHLAAPAFCLMYC